MRSRSPATLAADQRLQADAHKRARRKADQGWKGGAFIDYRSTMISEINLPRPRPQRRSFAGASMQLEPLAERHLDDLWDASVGAENSWTHLAYGPFSTPAEMAAQVEELRNRVEQPFWAVRPKSSGRAEGWLSLCDVDPAAAAIEIGSIWFAPSLQRTRASTEAVFLLMSYAMDVLGYHRLVWRCSAENRASLAAAARYGFRPEGVWRSARFKNGCFVDVAWHSIVGDEWLERRRAIAEWLADDNFDASGRALRSLAAPPKDTA